MLTQRAPLVRFMPPRRRLRPRWRKGWEQARLTEETVRVGINYKLGQSGAMICNDERICEGYAAIWRLSDANTVCSATKFSSGISRRGRSCKIAKAAA